jgi:GntR family transcriptional regulator
METTAYDVTPATRLVLARAREEALGRGAPTVQPEHLLRALAWSDGGWDPEAIFAEVGLAPEAALRDPRESSPADPGGVTPTPLHFSARTVRVLDSASERASDAGASGVRPEDVFRALARVDMGAAGELLRGRMHAAGRSARFRFRIDDAAATRLYEQLVDQVKEAVARGVLEGGDRLPPVRSVADRLDISPATVGRAYRELERGGLVVTRGSRGTRVATGRGAGLDEVHTRRRLMELLRPVIVEGYHLGATAQEVRTVVEEVLEDIFGDR